MKTKDVGEKGLISDLISPKFKYSIDYGMGDDAAYIDIADASVLVTTDKIPEDLMALRMGLMSPFEHGRYLSEVNISDIAAMGGVPIALLLNLTMPDDFSVDYLSAFLDGVKASCDRWNVVVVGGDTKWGGSASFVATCIGQANNNNILKRSGAKIGDEIHVTNMFGLFSTALAYFIVAEPKGMKLEESELEFLKKKLIYPEARVSEGMFLSSQDCCTACMDITDGFSQSIHELGNASSVVFEIHENKFDYHPLTLKVAEFLSLKPKDIAFGVGLDLELLFTTNSACNPLLQNRYLSIGKAVAGTQNYLIDSKGSKSMIDAKGWAHFSGKSPHDLVKDNININSLTKA